VTIYDRVYIGIDVHRREHRVALITGCLLEQPGANWKKPLMVSIGNNLYDFERLFTFIGEHAVSPLQVFIAVDYTGGHYSEPLIHFLQKQGYTVYHLDAMTFKSIKERLLGEDNKTDTLDAACAAYALYLRDVHGPSFRIPVIRSQLDSHARLLKSLILQREQYLKLSVQMTNRLHQFLLAVFPEGEAKHFTALQRIVPHYPTPEDILANGLNNIGSMRKKTKEAIIALAARTVGIPGRVYKDLIKDLGRQRIIAIAKCNALKEDIAREVVINPYGNILLSFPSLGVIAAATIIATIDDINRWPDKKKFKKMLGVYVSQRQSGTSLNRGRMGKTGSRYARKALFLVILSPHFPYQTGDISRH